jgi:hypothetical protein
MTVIELDCQAKTIYQVDRIRRWVVSQIVRQLILATAYVIRHAKLGAVASHLTLADQALHLEYVES